jgi:hypothetical protein
MRAIRRLLGVGVALFCLAAGVAQAETFSAERGAALWTKEVNGQSCTSCHGKTPKSVGKHTKTGKRIEPMAPSVNPKRLTDPAEIEKWFLRNCKSVYGRECTAQEKGDILLWLGKQ